MAAPEEAHTFDYSHADRRCDIVMKGGITSGVVYPLAVCELARAYRFKNIGGTSVGAIAAAAVAAAEYGRYSGSSSGFSKLERLPWWLGLRPEPELTNLVALFKPQPATEAVFETLIEGIKHRTNRLAWILVGAIRCFRLWAFLGAIPGVAVLAILAWALSRVSWWLAAVPLALSGLLVLTSVFLDVLLRLLGVLLRRARRRTFFRNVLLRLARRRAALAVGLLLIPLFLVPVGAVVAAAVALVRRALRVIPDNYFGLCSGAGEEAEEAPDPLAEDRSPEALTSWLAALLDKMAGKTNPNEPLTFGDLWWAGKAEPRPSAAEFGEPAERERVINLAMITTSLTLGRPYRLPFEKRAFANGQVIFYFKSKDARRFFPRRIVDWMERKASQTFEDGYFSFPEAADLPVVVAARLSLSFPVLLSAVPLYVRDETKGAFERCWFSDGGITSNFPIHFFDSPLPRWPTFGINLRGPRRRDNRRVWMLDSYDETTEDSWDEIKGLKDFFHSIKDTMQNWMDNGQLRLPGWRDRIANIGFGPGEGGLNLYLTKTNIKTLSDRGWEAGKGLRLRFTADSADPDAITWDSHRWVRYRSSMSVIVGAFRAIGRGWTGVQWVDDQPRPGDRTFQQLIARGTNDPPSYYRWTDAARQAEAEQATKCLIDLVGQWDPISAFREGAPTPHPDLRVAPRL